MALAFIHTGDYSDIIDSEELDLITQESASILASAERKAVAKIQKYLLRKYNVDVLFQPIQDNDVGTSADIRDATLVEYAIYFTLYILYTRIAKRNVPEDRYEQYKEARDFFKDVQQDMITPGWPLLKNACGETAVSGVRMSSDKPNSFYY